MRYRKRPVEVEAVQLLWSTWDDVCALVGEGVQGVWLHPTDDTRYFVDWRATGEWGPEARIGCVIPTLEGRMLARQGDWIIKGVKGELYPCRDEIFRATYEDAE